MNKKGLIGLIVVAIILLVVGFFWFVAQHDSLKTENKIKCIPAGCCHSTKCVLKNESPNCSETLCTMNCVPHTLDCGQGSCKYIKGKCEAILNE